MKGTFKILFVSSDEGLTSELANRVKKAYQKVPLEFDFANDGSKALMLFERKVPHLVVSEVNLPVMNGDALVSEIRRTEGSTTVFLLGTNEIEIEDSGVEFFKLPITNWSEFLGGVEDTIPEEIKAEFGIAKRDTILIRKLEEYAKTRFNLDEVHTEKCTLLPISIIPKYFDQEESDQIEVFSKNKEQITDSSHEEEIVVSDKRFILQQVMELLVLFILLGISFYLHKSGGDDFDEESIFNLKNAMTGITGLAFVGYFFGKVIERFVLTKGK